MARWPARLRGRLRRVLRVVDRDPTAVIATHARDGRAVWLHDTAKALAERSDRRSATATWPPGSTCLVRER